MEKKFAIWTQSGWLKSPTYTYGLIPGVQGVETVPTTMDSRAAFLMTEADIRVCWNELQRMGVASWIMEMRTDIENHIQSTWKKSV